MIVVQAGAVGILIARAFKAAALGSAQEGSEGSRLEGDNTLPAITAADMGLFVQRVIALAVEAVGSLGEGQMGGVVVGRVFIVLVTRVPYIAAAVFNCVSIAIETGLTLLYGIWLFVNGVR